jgi:hypothetical protein
MILIHIADICLLLFSTIAGQSGDEEIKRIFFAAYPPR